MDPDPENYIRGKDFSSAPFETLCGQKIMAFFLEHCK